jgi:hypothetical protein
MSSEERSAIASSSSATSALSMTETIPAEDAGNPGEGQTETIASGQPEAGYSTLNWPDIGSSFNEPEINIWDEERYFVENSVIQQLTNNRHEGAYELFFSLAYDKELSCLFGVPLRKLEANFAANGGPRFLKDKFSDSSASPVMRRVLPTSNGILSKDDLMRRGAEAIAHILPHESSNIGSFTPVFLVLMIKHYFRIGARTQSRSRVF